jgi:hypothetical protein
MARNVSAKPADKGTIASYLERACSGGVGRACRSLLSSEGNAMSQARERDLLDRACRAQDDEACSRLEATNASLELPTNSTSTRKQ